MIGTVLAIALQTMSQSDLLAEGERLGRMTAVMGVCSSMGYAIDEEGGGRLAADFEARAVAAGYMKSVAVQAFRSGVEREKLDLRMDAEVSEMTDEQLRRYATDTITRIKRRCREVAGERPGLISDLARGEQNADAQLAIMLRPLG